MKTLSYLFVFMFAVSILSCNNSNNKETKNTKFVEKTTTENALLPNKVIIYDEVNFSEQSIPEWISGVDSSLMTNLNKQVINSDIQVYSSTIYYEPDSKIKMTDKDILLNMETSIPGSISSLYFIESWFFDKDNYRLSKQIESWSPVYEYYKENKDGVIDSTQKVKKLLYDVRGSSEKEDETLIAKNITYEVNFSENQKTNDYLNLNKLSHLIIDPVLNGKKKAFDFFDRTELDTMEIKQNFGYRLDSLEEEDPNTGKWIWKRHETKESLSDVEAFIFVEDWYLDNKTFAIRKEVKSIAPVIVKIKVDENGEAYTSKKIAFLVNL